MFIALIIIAKILETIKFPSTTAGIYYKVLVYTQNEILVGNK